MQYQQQTAGTGRCGFLRRAGVALLAICIAGAIVPAVYSQTAGARAASPTGSWPCGSEIEKPGVLPDRSPTHIGVMVSRYEGLVCTIEAYPKAHIPMVGIYDNEFTPSEFGDDAGMYLVIPWVARATGLELPRAVDFFFASTISLAVLAGIAGIFVFTANWRVRLVTMIAYALLTVLCLVTGDVYIIQAALPMAFVPWILRLIQGTNFPRSTWVLLPLLGIVMGAADEIRSNAGTSTLIFTLLLLLFASREQRPKKALAAAIMICAMAAPFLYFRHVINLRNQFLQEHAARYTTAQPRHPFWHAVYVGFGFLSNDYVPAYADKVAKNKVDSIAPGTEYLSPEYEAILRHQVWLLAEHHPMLVLNTIFAKLGIMAAMILAYANFGILAAWKRPKRFPIEIAFWAAIAFNSLFGLLVVPRANYLLGMISFCALYAIASIAHYLQDGTDAGQSGKARHDRRDMRDRVEPESVGTSHAIGAM